MKKNKETKILFAIKQYLINNKKEYIIVSLIFIIGIFIGVLFINNIKEGQIAEINSYLNNFVSKFKDMENINYTQLLKSCVTEKLILAISIWFFGTTVIGIPIVFGILIYRGFCLGYTISACVTSLGTSKGIIFTLSTLVLQNIIFIPAILALAVSGIKLYRSIVKNKENIKLEILRHTLFSSIMVIALIFAEIIDVFISTNFLKLIIKYF